MEWMYTEHWLGGFFADTLVAEWFTSNLEARGNIRA